MTKYLRIFNFIIFTLLIVLCAPFSVQAALSDSLTVGSRGSQVKELQQRLTILGFYTGPITNYFGPLTRDSVIKFQKTYNIFPHAGYVGNLTRGKLNEMSAPNTDASIGEIRTPSQAKIAQTYYSVVKVIDGDTLSIQINGKVQTLRLIGLDTPETVDPRKPVQCFGREASAKAKEILTGQQVRIETDQTQDEYDKYNRLLAYVFLPEGTLLNEMMIREGYGHEYTHQTPYKYQNEFRAAENEARNKKRGLWADGACNQSNIIPITQSTTISPSRYDNSANTPTDSSHARTNGSYVCTVNKYNCSDFMTHFEAQVTYEACGGPANDIHKLDNDKDGQACESLP